MVRHSTPLTTLRSMRAGQGFGRMERTREEKGMDAWSETLPDIIVPFKKRVYRAVLEEFRDLI